MIETRRSRSKYYLQLFGKPSISVDRPKELQFSTRRALQLLAILAINPDHEFSRLELGRILWPDDFDDSNRIKFRQELLRLTSTLGPASEIVLRDKSHVQFRSEGCHSDVAELKLLCAELKRERSEGEDLHRQILAITERDFLEGKSDPWIDIQRERFESIRSNSLAALQETYVPRSLVNFQIPDQTDFHATRAAENHEIENASAPQAKAKISVPELVGPVFCGRTADLDELKKILLDQGSSPCRLLTILGPGGVGKTRVAQELCNLGRDWFHSRTWFVNLADHTNTDFIIPEVLGKLGLTADTSTDVLETIRNGLEHEQERSLIVLDNLEQFSDCGAGVVSRLLQEVPELTIVGTSRKPVLISHEQQYRLYPLDTKEEDSSAATMFIELARKIDKDFEASTANMRVVKEIVSILEGVPLSISLAASRINATNLEALRDSLQSKVVSLVTRNRDVSDRHQTLRACIDWSYELLPLKFRKPFTRLAVFAGGWFEEGAQRVLGCADCAEFMEELETSSLISSVLVSGVKHYNMLECIREYAYEKLDREEIDQLKLAHFEALNDFCKELTRQVSGKGQQEWIARGETEADNIREALLWSVDFQPSRSVGFLTNQMGFWYGSSRYNEGVKLLEHVQRNCNVKEDAQWAKLCWLVGAVFTAKGEFKRALEFLLTSIRIFRRENNPKGMSSSLYNLADFYLITGEYENGIQTCLENLKWVSPDNVRDVTYPKSALAECLINVGRLREAKIVVDELLSKSDGHGEPICRMLPYQASTLLGIETCDLTRAEDALTHAKAILATIETPGMHANFHYIRGLVCQKAGRRAEAIESLEAARTLFERIGDRTNLARSETSLAECIYADDPRTAIALIAKSFIAFGSLSLLAGQLRCCQRLICMRAAEMNPLDVLRLLDTLQHLGREFGVLFKPSEQRVISAVRLACSGGVSTPASEQDGSRVQRMSLEELFAQSQSTSKSSTHSWVL